MFRIVFQIPKDDSWRGEEIAQRINDIIFGSHMPARFDKPDDKWWLGGMNDWWLRIGLDGRGEITNRGGESVENMQALAAILRWRAHLSDARVE